MSYVCWKNEQLKQTNKQISWKMACQMLQNCTYMLFNELKCLFYLIQIYICFYRLEILVVTLCSNDNVIFDHLSPNGLNTFRYWLFCDESGFKSREIR